MKVPLAAAFFFLSICFLNEPAFPGEIPRESTLRIENEAKALKDQWSSDSYRGSIDLYLKASKQWMSLREFGRASSCLREASRLYLILADHENAAIRLKEALKIAVSNNLIDEQIFTTGLLSQVSLKAGNIKESEKYYKQAVQLSELTSNPLAIGAAFFAAGLHNYSNGNAEETIKLLQKALASAEKTEEKTLIAEIQLFLGFTWIRQGNPILALQEVNNSLLNWQESGDKRGQARACVGIGFVYSVMDQKQNALSFYQKANMLFPEDIDLLEKASSYNGIATIYEEYGEPTLAERYRQRALEFYRKENYLYGQLATLPSLAKLSYLKGDKDLAYRYYDDALILAKKLNDLFHLAIIKEGLGNMESDGGFYDNAIGNYQEALSTYKKLKIQLPRVQNLLGAALEKKGETRLAYHHYDLALEINRNIKDKFAESQTLYNLANLSSTENKIEDALELAKQSIQITENLSSDVLNSKLKSTYFSSIYDRYKLYIHLLMRSHRQKPDGDFAIQALQVSEKARARSMLETLTLSEANFIKDADPAVIKREREIRGLLDLKSDEVTDLLSSGGDPAGVQKLDSEMSELNNEIEELKAALKKTSPLYSAIKDPDLFDVGKFQANILDDATLLLEFSLDKNESHLWLVGKDKVNSYVLPPRDQIESRVDLLRELLASREMKKDEAVDVYQARIAKAETDYWQEAQKLSDEILGPAADEIRDKRLLVVADGKLHYMPISTLPLPYSNKNEPLLLTNEVIYEPSAMILSLVAENEKRSVERPKNLLIFSDPVFSGEDSRLSAGITKEDNANSDTEDKFRFVESMNSLPRLPASKMEGESISDIMGSTGVDIFTGFSANREQLMNLKIENYKIIHFATHGFINEARPELSAIVFSGFNDKGEKLEQLLRIQDIYAMDVRAELVVLSACSTGMGKEVKGEGLMSLNNAFLGTGAKSVVSTLWKVEDSATVELMKNFYGSMAAGNVSPSKALRDAQIKMWQSGRYRSPFYWGAFTIQGNLNKPLLLSSDRGYIAWTFFGVLILAVPGYWIYKRRRAVR